MNYLGPTAAIAAFRLYQAQKFAASTEGNFLFLGWGPRGTGKTTLLRQIAQTLTRMGSDTSPDLRQAQCLGLVDYRNGQSVSVDVVRKWRDTVCYKPMFVEAPTRRVFWVDECDGMGDAALNEWRTFIDTLPAGNDVLLSTNRDLGALQPQLQSRAMQSEFKSIPPEDIIPHLVALGLPETAAAGIAGACGGDVRAALNDARSALDYIEMLRAA